MYRNELSYIITLSAILVFDLARERQLSVLHLTDDQRLHILELIERDEEIPLEYKSLLFPPERREYELVYAGKEREEDVLANTMGIPLQPIRSFGESRSGWSNMLIFGDNLQAMKTLLSFKQQGKLINADGTPGVRLVYIDPPFATRREFSGNQDEIAYHDRVLGAMFIEFLRKRLVFLRELLSENGSIYVHLDWRKVHYMKVVLDEIFGEHNFRNEIIWKRQTAHGDVGQGAKHLGRLHDTILLYTKNSDYRWNQVFTSYTSEYIESFYRHVEEETGRRYQLGDLTAPGGASKGNPRYEFLGVTRFWRFSEERMKELYRDGIVVQTRPGAVPRLKRYLDEMSGVPLQDIWDDILPIQSQAKERLGYPTQKPEELLQRILSISSNPGDLVLDAFAGSGTTLAVAEKLNRRWIGIDCGKLAIYTIQKRMLNLQNEIGNGGGEPIELAPYTLFNAGLYDFDLLRELPREGWRSYALGLFECRDEPHSIKGVELDGYRAGDDVLVFDHTASGGAMLDYGFIDDLHSQIGSRLGSVFYIIAPAASVAFLEDYIDRDDTRYYILRIPYSIINELHSRNFEAIVQPVDEGQVNETVEAVGFDFIKSPQVECDYFSCKADGNDFEDLVIRIRTFKSEALAKGASKKENLESLSMILIDYDYPYDPERTGEAPLPPFEMDDVFYATDIQHMDWEVRLPSKEVGDYIALIYLDIYGNEYTEIKARADFSN